MGRKSIKEDKSIYQRIREELNLTRAEACENSFISSSRLEKIESGKSSMQPDEVKELSRIYKRPILLNYYCSKICPIGINNIREIPDKELSQISLETLSLLNSLQRQRDKLIDIASDNKIDISEYKEFKKIKADLDKISLTIDSLKLWLDEQISNGTIDEELLNK